MSESEREYREECSRYFNIVAAWLEEDPEDPEVAAKIAERAQDEGIECDPEDEDSVLDARQALLERMAEFALSVDVTVIKTVVLATGGPEYGFEAKCSENGAEVDCVRFYYQGWFQPRIYMELSDEAEQLVIETFGLEY